MSDITLRSAPISRAALLALLLLGAAALRLWGLGSDPAATDEARMLHHSALVWGSAHAGETPGERLPREPSLALPLHVAAQSVYLAAGSLTGKIHGLADLRRRLEAPTHDLLAVGRILSLLFGVLSIGLIFVLAQRVAGAGWVAAVLLALNPAAVSASQRSTSDALFLALVLAGLLALDTLAEDPSRRRALVAGLMVGLAGSVRFAGFLMLVPLLVLLAFGRKRGARAEHLGVACVAAALAFVVTSPLVAADPGAAMEAARLQLFRLRVGAFGSGSQTAAAVAYARSLLSGALGIPALLLTIVGFVILARSRARRFVGPASFALAYAIAIGVWRYADSRFLLPLIAVLLVAAGAAASRAVWTNAGARRALVPALLVVIAAAPGTRDLLRRERAREGGDTRRKALDWIQASLPRTASFALERYGPSLDEDSHVVYWIPFHSVTPHVYDHAYHVDWYRGFDYIVVNETMESRYASDPKGFKPQVDFYLSLARDEEFVKGFEPGAGSGPAIAIYKVRSHDLRLGALDSLLASTPRSREMSDFLNSLGAAYSHLGKAAIAASMQRVALEIVPGGDERVYANLGATYIAAGRPDAALEVLKEGVKRFPEAPELRYNLGRAYRAKRIDDRAAMEFEQAIRLKPTLADAHLSLSQVYADLGRYPEAAAALDAYLRLEPDSPRRGDILEAIKYLRTHPAPVHPAGAG